MRKVKVIIEPIDEKIAKDKLGFNYWIAQQYNLIIESERNKCSTSIRLIKEMNGVKYSDKYLEGEVLLDLIDNLRIAKDYNFFKELDDIEEFYEYYGFETCKDALKTAKSVLSVARVIEGLPLTEDELNKYSEIASEGEIEDIERARDELVDKYFVMERK